MSHQQKQQRRLPVPPPLKTGCTCRSLSLPSSSRLCIPRNLAQSHYPAKMCGKEWGVQTRKEASLMAADNRLYNKLRLPQGRHWKGQTAVHHVAQSGRWQDEKHISPEVRTRRPRREAMSFVSS